jgi:hypothetical protein
MGKINKMLIGTAAIFIAALVLVSMAQAAPPVFVWDIDMYEGNNGLYGEVGLKSHAGENITAQLNVEVDDISVYNGSVQMDVELFKGFPVSRVVYTEFVVNNEVGNHIIVVTVYIGEDVLNEEFDYTIYEPEDTEEEEIIEEQTTVSGIGNEILDYNNTVGNAKHNTSLYSIIKSHFGCPDDVIHLSDDHYDRISNEEMNAFLEQDDTNLISFVPEIFDCDDFALHLLLTARMHFGTQNKNVAIGILWVDQHAVNFYVNMSCNITVFDPQTEEEYCWEGEVDFIYI